jgi:hypothetical protein
MSDESRTSDKYARFDAHDPGSAKKKRARRRAQGEKNAKNFPCTAVLLVMRHGRAVFLFLIHLLSPVVVRGGDGLTGC